MQSKLNVLTVCSGIGAPEYAWRDLPFNFIGCSEIEPFPSAVLQHHYPTVKNYGDMNNYKDWNFNGTTPDILVGGTPCQSFSISGLRAGLDSPNGNLALVFVAMAERFRPRWVIWENVVGVLSSKSNGKRDFGAFLGAFRHIGYSFSYRVLDAQYWGIPQRRRRVFACFHNRDWRRAAAVLFEPESLRGGVKKGGKNRKDVAPTVTTGAPYSRTGNERVEADALVVANSKEWPAKIGSTLDVAYATKLGLENQHVLGGAKLFWEQNERARRLMPSEAEALQGFPRNYTDITYRGKDAPDTQRYKALGNSMAVPVVRWLGQRIQMVEAVSNE
jgi:DNA (cytosine-5)-methyltransferase 1